MALATAIIQARMGSSRLRGKTLMEIMDRSLLEWVICSTKKLRFVGKIIVATSNLKEDQAIVSLCKKIGIECFRGDSLNVLSRFIEISKSMSEDHQVVRITADNPISWSEKSQELFNIHVQNNSDYTSIKGLSHVVCEILKAGALHRVANEQGLTDYDKEHVTPFFRSNNQKYKILEIEPAAMGLNAGLEKFLTIDSKEDYERFQQMAYAFDFIEVLNFDHIYKWVEANCNAG